MNSLVTFRCAAVAIAALVSGSALAVAPADPMKTVSYADLNLKSTAGVASLYRRIQRAAREVCLMPRGTKQFVIESGIKACKADSIDRAILQANLPALSALHLTKTGRKVETDQYADRR